MVMMAMLWVVWNVRNNRMFNKKSKSILDLLDSIFYFGFLAGAWFLPLKRKVVLGSTTTRKKKRDKNRSIKDIRIT